MWYTEALHIHVEKTCDLQVFQHYDECCSGVRKKSVAKPLAEFVTHANEQHEKKTKKKVRSYIKQLI